MWILKFLIKAMHPKEKIKIGIQILYSKRLLNSSIKNLPPFKSILCPYIPNSTIINHPWFPSSIFGSYVPKSTSSPPSKSLNVKSNFLSSLQHPSRCVPMLILSKFPSTHTQIIQYPIYYPTPIFHPSIPLIKSFA